MCDVIPERFQSVSLEMKLNHLGYRLYAVHIIGQTGPGELSEDGEMNEMTLPSRHRTRNSSPGCLKPSTLRLNHGGSPQY